MQLLFLLHWEGKRHTETNHHIQKVYSTGKGMSKFWQRHSLKVPLPLMVNTCLSLPVVMTTSTLIHAQMYPDLHDNFMVTLL